MHAVAPVITYNRHYERGRIERAGGFQAVFAGVKSCESEPEAFRQF